MRHHHEEAPTQRTKPGMHIYICKHAFDMRAVAATVQQWQQEIVGGFPRSRRRIQFLPNYDAIRMVNSTPPVGIPVHVGPRPQYFFGIIVSKRFKIAENSADIKHTYRAAQAARAVCLTSHAHATQVSQC